MQELLALCIRVGELANAVYLDMAERCTDADVSRVLGRLAVEEASHVGWWRELLDAWNAGLLPDVWTDSDEALGRLLAIVAELEGSSPSGDAPLDAETALTAAVRIEFFALDPVFAELIDLTEPAVSHVRRDAYSRHVESLIEAVERHFPPDGLTYFLAHVLRRAQHQNRVLTSYATRDALTGLANRRALTTHLDQWAAWAARYGHPVTLLLLDVDLFKSINDSHGHLAGDEVLRAVGAALSSVVRGADFAARYGGDEFAVIAPELGVGDAEALAVRIHEAVRAIAVTSADGAVVRAAVSIGIGVLREPAGSPPGPVDRLLAAADRSLYAAKQAGRDRAGAPVVVGAETSA